jgi:hypothetical protein
MVLVRLAEFLNRDLTGVSSEVLGGKVFELLLGELEVDGFQEAPLWGCVNEAGWWLALA